MLAELIAIACINSGYTDACNKAATATTMQIGLWEDAERVSKGVEKGVVDTLGEAMLMTGAFMISATSGNPTISLSGGPICDNIFVNKEVIRLSWRF